jgi:hypothetical protein
LATRCPRAYRRVPHSSGGRWNLWAGVRTDKFCLDADFHATSRDLLHAANLATWDPRFYFPSEGRRAEDFSALKNSTVSAGFEPANLGTRGPGSLSVAIEVHTNTTSEHSIIYFHTTRFGRSIWPPSGRQHKYINRKVCYARGLSFTMSLIQNFN